MIRSEWLLLLSVLFVPAAASAAKPVVTVAADGSGQFTTVQAAVDAAPEDGGEVIRLKPGTYREKVLVTKSGLEFRGLGKKPEDTVITWDDSAGRAGGTNKSYTVGVLGNDFIATDLTIENNYEKLHGRTEQGAQAVALMVTGDREVFRRVRFIGYQDTLFAQSKTCHNSTDATDQPCRASRQLFEDCYIAGHVDFIFGDAKAVFKNCELHAMQHFEVMLTAQSKVYPLEDSGYLFLNTTVTADPGVQKIDFGRPWRANARVYFVNTKFVPPAVVAPEGWREWGGRLATADYAEYNTMPAPDVAQRAQPSRQLTKAEAAKLTVKDWLQDWDAEAVR